MKKHNLADSMELERDVHTKSNYWSVKEQDIVCVPSLSFNQDELSKITGAIYYEERQLFNILLLKNPETRLIYVTSMPLDPQIVQYYLDLTSGRDPTRLAELNERLTLLSTNDLSPKPLAEKMLERPHLTDRIKSLLRPNTGLLLCYTSTQHECQLAKVLGVPIYGLNSPDLSHWGSKSGSREIFEEADIPFARGVSISHSSEELANKIATFYNSTRVTKMVVKLDEGFSGEGNAILKLSNLPEQVSEANILEELAKMEYTCPKETWNTFQPKISLMGAIAEEFFEGEQPSCPSVQGCIALSGDVEIVSTHEQVLHGQVYQGCNFPASDAYRTLIQRYGRRVGRLLAKKGVRGHFGVDFLVKSAASAEEPEVYALEINLRQCGTTHPYFTMKFLTDGVYDKKTGLCRSSKGAVKYYTSTDNLHRESYKGLLPQDVVDGFAARNLTFDAESQCGIAFHLMGSLSEHGKLGITCVGDSLKQATDLFARVESVMEELSTTPTKAHKDVPEQQLSHVGKSMPEQVISLPRE